LEQLRSIWQKTPKLMQHDTQLLEVYVESLIDLGDHDTAEKTIQRALKREWSSTLVRQYGLLRVDDIPRQLAKAEAWLTAHPQDSQLHLCLGRLSARAELWGKARDYFESSYRLAPSAETCAELGRLLTGLGEPKVAAAYFREGLLLSHSALPDLPIPPSISSTSETLTTT
jgi:HemY protein